nr:MAG TPA: hypothetical protein [Caudoviricetes sp.]
MVMTMCYYGSTDKENRTSTPSGLSVFSKFYLQKIVLMIFHVTCSLSFLLIPTGSDLNRSFLFCRKRGGPDGEIYRMVDR